MVDQLDKLLAGQDNLPNWLDYAHLCRDDNNKLSHNGKVLSLVIFLQDEFYPPMSYH